MQYYFFLRDQAQPLNKQFSYKTLTRNVADALITIWSKLNMGILSRNRICTKLNSLLDRYQKATQNNKEKSFQEFADTLPELY